MKQTPTYIQVILNTRWISVEYEIVIITNYMLKNSKEKLSVLETCVEDRNKNIKED